MRKRSVILIVITALLALIAVPLYAQPDPCPDQLTCQQDPESGGSGGGSGATNQCPEGTCCICDQGLGCVAYQMWGDPAASHAQGNTWCWSYSWYCRVSGSSCEAWSGAPDTATESVLDWQGHPTTKATRAPYDVMSRQIDEALASVLWPSVLLALRNKVADVGSAEAEYHVYLKAASAATGLKLKPGDYITPKGHGKREPLSAVLQTRIIEAIQSIGASK
jgi:hypothetical protein